MSCPATSSKTQFLLPVTFVNPKSKILSCPFIKSTLLWLPASFIYIPKPPSSFVASNLQMPIAKIEFKVESSSCTSQRTKLPIPLHALCHKRQACCAQTHTQTTTLHTSQCTRSRQEGIRDRCRQTRAQTRYTSFWCSVVLQFEFLSLRESRDE